jgi:hypothetical protein
LEKWKKTMLSAAKQRRPVSAGRISFFFGAGAWVAAGAISEAGANSIWEMALRAGFLR